MFVFSLIMIASELCLCEVLSLSENKNLRKTSNAIRKISLDADSVYARINSFRILVDKFM